MQNFDVTKQIKSAFGKTVNMKNGTYLVIEHTEAMHVIDVNSGKKVDAKKDQEENALASKSRCCRRSCSSVKIARYGRNYCG